MKVTLQSTTKIVELNGVPARVWEGKTDSGIPVHAFITRIACPLDADQSAFEAELVECAPPSPELEVYPARLALGPRLATPPKELDLWGGGDDSDDD